MIGNDKTDKRGKNDGNDGNDNNKGSIHDKFTSTYISSVSNKV